MTKRKKLLDKLLSSPTDFTWDELSRVLKGFGYEPDNAGRTSGSRARFISTEHPPISLHRPHPKPILKRYQLDEVISLLKREKLI